MENSTNQSPECPVSASRYRAFASLVADGFWELDAELRYTFHDGCLGELPGLRRGDVVGESRAALLERNLGPSDALTRHNRLLQEHRPIDITLPVGDGGEDRGYVRVIAEPQFDADGSFTGYLGCGRNVTDRVQMEERLAHLATHDDLTGIHNRREFERRLAESCQSTHIAKQPRTLCLIDLDRFKLVNDTAGHQAGDQLLRDLCQLMREFVRADETLARLGGDEFGLLLNLEAGAALKVAESLISAIACYEFQWQDSRFRVGACVGLVQIPGHGADADALVAQADKACYEAKRCGRNQARLYSASDTVFSREQDELDRLVQIRKALEANRFCLLAQRIRPARDVLEPRHYELLLRLECDDGSLSTPASFIPLAERYDIMQDLDRWVVDTTIDILGRVNRQRRRLMLSVNLSANTLGDPASLAHIEERVSQASLPAGSLCLEFTETAAFRNIDSLQPFMRNLRERGVRFALDNFGSGLSSFTFLNRLQVDYLKIDGGIVRALEHDDDMRAIATMFNSLSHQLGVLTVAESVETVALRDILVGMQVDYLQGYAIGMPQRLESVRAISPPGEPGTDGRGTVPAPLPGVRAASG